MRILILSDAYLPDSTHAHSKMLHELSIQLGKLNHEVVVLTPGSKTQEKRLCVLQIDGVTVWKFRSSPTRGVSHIRRAINESLLSWYAYRALKSLNFNLKFQLVINYSPTIFFGALARWFGKNGAYVYLILRDFFPQWAIDQGLIKKDSLIARYFSFFENLNYRASDVIAVQSPANIGVFKDICNTKNYSIDVLYNWIASPSPIDSAFGVSLINELKLRDKFIFFYGGNIGHAQDVRYILRLAERLSEFDDIQFLLIGQGDQYETVKLNIEENMLQNVLLHPSINQVQYQSILTQVDVGLFTLAANHTAHNFPGKVLGYLSAGLPTLGAVNKGNDLIELINQSGAGRVSVNGDFADFVEDALHIYHNQSVRDDMSRSASNLLSEVFSVESAAKTILRSYDGRSH